MDPLTALGLSANVAQFVSYASELISASKEIYGSAKGATDKVLTLDAVYSELQDLSSRLEMSLQKDPKLNLVEGTSQIVKYIFGINDLSQSCKKDCDRLLEILHKLQAGKNRANHPLKSFMLALRTVWKSSEIAELENRLHHIQATLTLELCALTNYLAIGKTSSSVNLKPCAVKTKN